MPKFELPPLHKNQCGKRLSIMEDCQSEGRLCVGNAAVAKDFDFLHSTGFKAILSVGGGKSGSKHNGVLFKHIGVKDSPDDPLLPHFDPCCDFIKQQLDSTSGGRVLVHCRGGIHRSPCVVAAFLIRERGASVEKACHIVATSRSSAQFAQFQIEQLELFHQHCRESNEAPSEASPEASSEGLSPASIRLVDLSYSIIERDSDDDRFVVAFSVNDPPKKAWQFFDKYGFIVFRNVLDADQCRKTRQEMWATIESESPGLSRSDSSTWAQWSSSFGMPKQKVSFTPQICKNRTSPNIHKAFSIVMGTDRVVLSHDRFTIYRPTERGPDGPQFSTRTNLHLDIDPWKFLANESGIESLRFADPQDFIRENNSVIHASGPHIQAVLNLRDNVEEDGGTQVIPAFHKVFEEWANDERTIKGRNSDPLGGSYRLNPKDPLSRLGQRLPCREGSIILWDQRVMHGSVANRSKRLRMAQFMKAFPACSISELRQKARSSAIQRQLCAAGLSEWGSGLGPQEQEMFGIKLRS